MENTPFFRLGENGGSGPDPVLCLEVTVRPYGAKWLYDIIDHKAYCEDSLRLQ